MSTKRNHERAAVRIARKLVSEIRRRRLRPGSQLDAEHRMVEELGVRRWSECQTCDEILGIRLGPKQNVSASVILFFLLILTTTHRWRITFHMSSRTAAGSRM